MPEISFSYILRTFSGVLNRLKKSKDGPEDNEF